MVIQLELEEVKETVTDLLEAVPLVTDAILSRNITALQSLAGPSYRSLWASKGSLKLPAVTQTHLNLEFTTETEGLAKLYDYLLDNQWKVNDLPWSTRIDPLNPETPLIAESFHPLYKHPRWNTFSAEEKSHHMYSLVSWVMSQFLYGERAAREVASQITLAVPWEDAKAFSTAQSNDESRHVQVFERYLKERLFLKEPVVINKNLLWVIDSIASEPEIDKRFLGMHIMIEGLALGAFGLMKKATSDGVLQSAFELIMRDEGLHVTFGVETLKRIYAEGNFSPAEMRHREEWALQLLRLLRNRFRMTEIYDASFGHMMNRAEWNRYCASSPLMDSFRGGVSHQIIRRLRDAGLVSARILPKYRALGLLPKE
jgi:hypothetical protein